MVKRILLAVLVLIGVGIAAVLGLAATKPDAVRVERTTVVNAPPEKIFPYISDLRRWDAWSPWEKKDPAMQRTFSGAETGTGAAYAWEGDSSVGKGRMEITEATAPSKVTIKLDFIAPFEGHNTGTSVTWAMHGPSPYLQKVMSVFFSMDSMIGKEFEAGLASLKALAEG